MKNISLKKHPIKVNEKKQGPTERMSKTEKKSHTGNISNPI